MAKFKLDENLPTETALLLRSAGARYRYRHR
jgi:hypothetical protein